MLKSKTPANKHQDLNASRLQKRVNETKERNETGSLSVLGRSINNLEQDIVKPRDSDIKLKVLSSMQKADLYHFKVMELRAHEDTKGMSDCSLKFHFMFECLKQKEREYLKIFEWDIASKPIQRIYLSRNTLRLMEVINDFIATVYVRTNVDDVSGASILSRSMSELGRRSSFS